MTAAPAGTAALPRLVLLFSHADHPHRDPVCATLAWLAEAEGALFECYFESAHSGIHFGGGHPGWYQPEDLRGPTVTGDRHVETLNLLLQRFRCEAACLGPTMFEGPLRDAGVTILTTAGDVATFYRDVFAAGSVAWPDTLLVVGDGGRPQGVSLRPYAFPEIVGRRALAVAEGDTEAAEALAPGMTPASLWLSPAGRAAWAAEGRDPASAAPAPETQTVAAQTAWMATRWEAARRGFVLGDPELVGRWAPTAVRRGWMPLYGIPQVDVIERLSEELAATPLAYGRQHHDSDFFRLSELGTSFQVIDPGSPPFPVLAESRTPWRPAPDDGSEPSDGQLRQWADEGRVLVTLLFWSGMIRELQNLFPLADLLSLTGLWCGLVLTTESYRHGAGTPLELINVARESGGLFPRVEPLLTDTGSGVIIAADAPPDAFAATLRRSVDTLAADLGNRACVPRGWWAHMDARMVPAPTPRVSRFPDRPRLRIRYRARELELDEPPALTAAGAGAPGLRALVRDSPLGRYFAPLRPYESTRPAAASRAVLEAVRDCGFEYAVTKTAFGPVPRVVTGVDGLTVFNHTAGRWDGWSPFFTVNSLSDLVDAERHILGTGRPGWVVGAVDTCLWTFTGPVWERGTELLALCRWAANGGAGRLVNVTPRTVARYARLLQETGRVEALEPTPAPGPVTEPRSGAPSAPMRSGAAP